MTSNVGAKKVSDMGAGTGFQSNSSQEQLYEVKKTVIQKSLKQQFNPEFLNRIDDIILFNPLNTEALKTIVNIELGNLKKRLDEKRYNVTIDESVAEKVFQLNVQEEYGARPLKRIIQNLCEDFLSEEILRGNLKEEKKVILKYENDQLVILKK